MIGLLTIAINHPGYGEAAHNLAASFRALLPGMPTALITHEGMDVNPKLFDQVILVKKGINPFQLKTQVYKLSPFKETLFVDADSLCVTDPSALLDSLKGFEFACMENRRYSSPEDYSKMAWATLPEFYAYFGLPSGTEVPEYNTSCFFFKKAPRVKKYFEKVAKLYGSDIRLKEKVQGYWPDELAYGAASALTGVYSEIRGWQPAYLEWPGNRVLSISEIQSKYTLITFSGTGKPSHLLQTMYNGRARSSCRSLGVPAYIWGNRMKPNTK